MYQSQRVKNIINKNRAAVKLELGFPKLDSCLFSAAVSQTMAL